MRACKDDADAKASVEACRLRKHSLLATQLEMLKGARSAADRDTMVTAEFFQWAPSSCDRDLKWIEKNRKILQLHLDAQVGKKDTKNDKKS